MFLKIQKHTSQRMIFNTGVLYAKMFITMGISLYSTRLILNYLGESDFGIFNLIAGIIASLLFLNNAMSISTQRYFSFYQGKGNVEIQKKLFVNSFILHIAIGFVIVVIMEILAPFLFNGFLNIAIDRVSTAKAVYHFMAISIFFTIVSVPFTALLNAHENMLWISLVRIIEAICKLIFSFTLVWFTQTERLEIYGILIAALSVISFILYATYCLRNYNECDFVGSKPDKALLREITGFAGWNTLTAFTGLGRSQGIAIVLNLFYGTVVNAAYGIANLVASQSQVFCTSMQQALNPQLMKSEGANDRQRMLNLSMKSSKLGFLILAFIAIPCIAEMPKILKLWLKIVPNNTVIFCSICLCIALVQQLFVGLYSAFQALGDLKKYVLICEGIIILNLPIGYFLIWFGLPTYSILVSLMILEGCAGIAKMLLISQKVNLTIREYLRRVVIPVAKPVMIVIAPVFAINYFFSFEYRFLLTFFVSTLVFGISVYLTSLEKEEKIMINNVLKSLTKKFLNNGNPRK
jgi:O-antigen/teichoic acid export membrane protein